LRRNRFLSGLEFEKLELRQMLAPLLLLENDTHTVEADPRVTAQTSFVVKGVAKDEGANPTYTVEFRDRTVGGNWSGWQTATNVTVNRGEISGVDNAYIETQFSGQADHEYSFRFSTVDVGSTVSSNETYISVTGENKGHGSNYIVLDFSPDVIANELQPANFLSMFESGAYTYSSHPFLDFDNDFVVNGSDAVIARDQITEDVRRRLLPLINAGGPGVDPLDIRVRGVRESLTVNNQEGQTLLDKGRQRDDLNVFVFYVGGALESQFPGASTTLGLAQQAGVDENLEGYGFVFAETAADRVLLEPNVDSKLYVERMSSAVVHELGHLIGLGHVEGDPEKDNSVMNYNAPIPTSLFLDDDNYQHQTELFSFEYNDFYHETLVNQHVEAYASFYYDGTNFEQLSRDQAYPYTIKEGLSGGKLEGDKISANLFDQADPVIQEPPASSVGTLGSTTANDVANALETGFAELRQRVADGFEFLLDLEDSIPLVTNDLGDLLEFREEVLAAIDTTALSTATTMSDIQSLLEGAGYVIDLFTSDSELAGLPSSQPADLFRATGTFQLPDLMANTTLDPAAIATISNLTGINFSGNLDVHADAFIALTFGYDTGGFYLLPGEVLRTDIDIRGAVDATAGIATVDGKADVGLAPFAVVETTNADGRIRIGDLTGGIAPMAEVTVRGVAQLQAEFEMEIYAGKSIKFPGQWLWYIDSNGSLLSTEPGFDVETLLDELADLAGTGLDQLNQLGTEIGGKVQGIPYVGDAIDALVESGILGELIYDNIYVSASDYLAERGFEVLNVVSGHQLVDYAVNGTALPDELIKLQYTNSSTTEFSDSVTGEQSFRVGAASLDFDLTGTVTGDLDSTLQMVLGIDSTGIFVEEGGSLDSDIAISGSMSGNTSVSGLVDIAVDANAIFTSNAEYRIDDGDGVADEKLYVFAGDLNGVFSNAGALTLTGDVDLQNVSFTATINALQNILPGLQLELSGSGNVDLATSTATATFDQNSLENSLATFFLAGANFFGDQAAAIAGIVLDVPVIGDSVHSGVEEKIHDALSFDPGTMTPLEYLNSNGFVELQTITVEELISGDYQSEELFRMRYNPATIVPASFDATLVDEFWEIAGGNAGMTLSGDVSTSLEIDIDLTFGVDATRGPFIVESTESAPALNVELVASGSLAGTARLGNLIDLAATATANAGVLGGMIFNDFDDNDDGRLFLMAVNSQPVYSVAPNVATKAERDQVIFLSGLNGGDFGDIEVMAELELANPASQLEIFSFIGLGDPFEWNVSATYDFENGLSDIEVVEDAKIEFIRNLLSGNEQAIIGKFLDQVDTYNPLPPLVRKALTTPLPFADESSGSILSILLGDGADGLDVIVNPDEYRDDSASEISAAEGLSFSFDAADNIIPLLMGEENVDLISMTYVDTHNLANLVIPVIPPTLLYSFFGIASVTGNVDLLASMDFGVDVKVGFDTGGFYLGENDDLLSLTGSVGVGVDLEGWLLAIPIVEVSGDGSIVLDVAVGIESPQDNGKVRVGEFGGATKQLSLDVGLDLGIEGILKATDLLILGTTGRQSHKIQLFSADTTVEDAERKLAEFREDLEREAQTASEILCVGGVATGNLVIAAAGCGAAYGAQVLDAAADFDSWRLERTNAIGRAGQQAIDRGSEWLGDRAEEIKDLGNRFDKEVLGPLRDLTNLDELFSSAYKSAKSIFGGGEWEALDVPRRDTFDVSMSGSALVVNWDGNEAADISVGFDVENQKIIVSGPQFVQSEEVAEKKSDCWDGCDYEYDYEDVLHLNILEFDSAGIEKIIINGTDGDDMLFVDGSITLDTELRGYDGNDKLIGARGNDSLLGGNGDDTLVGNFGDDTLEGGAGNDFLVGGFGDDILRGGDGDDYLDAETGDDYGINGFFLTPPSRANEQNTLVGGAGNDTLLGSDGSDDLEGGAGDDNLAGGRGDDTLLGEAGEDYLNGGVGNDSLFGGSDDDYLVGDQGQDTLWGGGGDDTLLGDNENESLVDSGNEADTLYGEAGFDLLEGGAGNDILSGGTDADVLDGSSGNDTLYGMSASDPTNANNGNDRLLGGSGDDILYAGIGGAGYVDWPGTGSESRQVLMGQEGDDQLYGQSGPDLLDGGVGDDTISGAGGDDVLVALDGADILDGGSGDDMIYGAAKYGLDQTPIQGTHITGGSGNDTIVGGAYVDTIYGGLGNDQIAGVAGDDLIFGNEGDDLIYGDKGNDLIVGNDGADTVFGGEDDDYIYGHSVSGVGDDLAGDILNGDEGADRIFGQGGDDQIFGDEGNDALRGNVGDDTIDGGTGADAAYGGEGDDTIFGGDGDDRLFGELGDDTIDGQVGDDHVEGADGEDTLTGGSGEDYLHGGADSDQIYGGLGDDRLFAGTGLDELHGEEGDDTITGSDNGDVTDPNFFDTTHFGDRIYGGTGDDEILGLGGADLIDAGAGDDKVESGVGADYVLGQAGDDWIYAGAGLGDQIFGGLGDDHLIGSHVGDDLIEGNEGRDKIYGQGGNDNVFGNEGDDFIDAGAGVDIVSGGLGNDEILGGGGVGDQLSGNEGDDILRGSDDGADIILGGLGSDTIFGYAGNDQLSGGGGDDKILGGLGDDLIEGDAGQDLLLGEGDHDRIYGHNLAAMADDNSVDYLYGDFGTNNDEADSGQDQLFGGGGNDLMFAEAGDDFIDSGSSSGDITNFGSGEGANPNDFNAPATTADPTVTPGTALFETPPLLPGNVSYTGRWSEQWLSDSSSAISGLGLLGIESNIALDGSGNLYAAWVDSRNGNFEIYVARKIAGGDWEQLGTSAEQGGISSSEFESRRPAISIDGSGNPVVAWTEFGANDNNVVAKVWNSGTSQWEFLGNDVVGGGLSQTGAADQVKVINTSSGLIAAWVDDSGSSSNVFARRWNGSSWVELAGSASSNGVSNTTNDVHEFDLATDGNKVAIAWSGSGTSVDQIFLREFDAGTWSALDGSTTGNGLSATLGDSSSPSVQYHAGEIFVAWQDDSSTDAPSSEIYVSRLFGSQWDIAGTDSNVGGGVSGSEGNAITPVLRSGGGELHLAWIDSLIESNSGDNVGLYSKQWNGFAFAEVIQGDASDRGISVANETPANLNMAVDATGRPFVSWQDSGPTQSGIHLIANTYPIDQSGGVHIADGSTGNTVQDLLDGITLSTGDVIVVTGDQAGFTVTNSDLGVTIIGTYGVSITGNILVDASDDVLLQRLNVSGSVSIQSSDRVGVVENQLSGMLTLDGGSDSQVLKNTYVEGGGVILQGSVASPVVEHNTFEGITTAIEVAGATNVTIVGNLVASSQSALDISLVSSGQISRNDFVATGSVTVINADFGGMIEGNRIHGGHVGVDHQALAVLSGNEIFDNVMGVVSSVDDATYSLGFDLQADPNEIFQNDIGVSLTGRIQRQHIYDNDVGVTGTGVLGGEELATANLIEDNRTGVNFNGTVQFNRIAGNETGVTLQDGSLLAHNLIYRNSLVGVLAMGVSDVRIINNTLFADSGENVLVNGVSSEVEIRNNVLWAEAGYNMHVANDSQSGFFSDYNLLHATESGGLVHWALGFDDILDWQQDVNRFDLNSIGTTVVNPVWSNPQFVSRALDDYQVMEITASQRFSSPSIDAGDPLTDLALSSIHQNLLQNAGFENGLSDWTTNTEATTETADPNPFEEQSYFTVGESSTGTANQVIDLVQAGYSTAQLDSLKFSITFGGRIRSAGFTGNYGQDQFVPDRGQVSLSFIDDSQQVISTVTVEAENATDRWELVGDRELIPTGTRKVEFSFFAASDDSSDAESFLDHAFVHVLETNFAPDQGGYGNTDQEPSSDVDPLVRVLSPDLYADWERQIAHEIRWETVGNDALSPVQIDLYQDGVNGAEFVATIDSATADDGYYLWTPQLNAVDFGTYGLRIQISLVGDSIVLDRSAETFTVPEDTNTFYVNDGLATNDEHTSTVGSNRNTGRISSAPKPNVVNLLRTYSVSSDDTLFVDSGNYRHFETVVLSGANGIGDDEGFTLTGPTNSANVASFSFADLDFVAPLVELNDADFMTIKHLTLVDAEYGIRIRNESTDVVATDLILTGHDESGIYSDSNSQIDLLERITAASNGEYGIYVDGAIEAVRESVANVNAFTGIYVVDPGAVELTQNVVMGNLQGGIVLTGSANGAVIGSEDLSMLLGNVVENNGGTGISANGDIVVAGNTVRGQLGGVGIYIVNGGEASFNVVQQNQTGIRGYYNTSILNNRVLQNHTGISSYQAQEIIGNVVYDNSKGVDANSGNTQILNNLIYNNVEFGIQSDTSNFNYSHNVLNNTVHQETGSAIIVSGVDTILRNNIIQVDSASGIVVSSEGQSGFQSDFNLFYITGDGSVGTWQDVERSSLTSWKFATFNDENSVTKDPSFVDLDGADDQLGYVDSGNDGRDDDFHLSSTEGRFTGSLTPVWTSPSGLPTMLNSTEVVDAVQSSGIDRGDKQDDNSLEPIPNGGFINLGAYGNTSQASKSPVEYVLVFLPDGGETWPAEQEFTIKWRSHDAVGNVRIDLLVDGTADPFVEIAAAEQNDGEFAWTIPASIPAGVDYRVEITRLDTQLSATSTGAFAITAPISAFYVNDGSLDGDVLLGPTGQPMGLGDDANDGLTPANPKASIRALLEAYDMEPGDVIFVNTGLYQLTANIEITSADDGVRIQGPGLAGAEALIDRDDTAGYVFELLGVSDVTIDSLGMTGGQRGVFIDGSDSVVVSNNRIFDNSETGVFIEGNAVSTSLLVTGNEVSGQQYGVQVSYLSTDETFDGTISNNRIFANDSFGVSISTYLTTALVRGNEVFSNRYGIAGGESVIEGNAVYDNIDYGIYTQKGTVVDNVIYGNETGIQSWDDGAVVKDNRVFNNQIGIGVNGGAVVSGNQVYNNVTGVHLVTYYSGQEIYATNNLIYNNSETGILVAPNRVETSTIVSNNTIYQPTGDGITVEAGATNEFSNNIIHVGSGSAFNVSDAGQAGFTSDYNLFELTGSGQIATWGTHQLSNRVDWFYELGFDGHGLEGDPQFVDIDGSDDRLGFDRTPIGSAIILDDEDAGVVLTGEDWTEYTDQGLGGDYWRITDSTGTARATWTFDSLTPGTYELAVTYPVNGSHDVAYDATTETGELLMSKRASQSSSQILDDFVEGGVGWRRLGFIEVTGDTVNVTLKNNYNTSSMAADGMLLRQVAGGGGADDNFHLSPGSLGIDGGDPTSPYVLGEPSPSGDRINVGAYGGTSEATVSSGQLVQVLSPNGNEKVQVGDPVTVEWRTGGLLDQQVIAQLNAGTEGFGSWKASPYLIEGDSRSWYAFEDAVDTSQVTEPAPQSVYQSFDQAEYGVGNRLAYDMSLADGIYNLALHFAEPYYNSVGDRVFDILANSNLIADDFDVVVQTGGELIATTVSFDLTVSAGTGLLLELVNVTDVQAFLSGIEIVRINAIGTVDPTVDLEVSTDGGTNWTTIGTDLPVDRYGNGSFAWTPDTASDNAIMRVVANSGSQPDDISDASFQIAPGGNEFYVNVLGDSDLTNNQFTTIGGLNLNHGKSADQPMSSLFALINAYDLTDGDIVYVDAGNYSPVGNVQITGADNGVRIQGPTTGGVEAIFDRGNRESGYVFELLGVRDVTIDSLGMTGGQHGVFIDGSDGVVVSNSRIFENSETGVFIDANAISTSLLVTGNEISGQQYGVQISYQSTDELFDGTISNNRIFGHNYQGISISAYLKTALVKSNEVFSNRYGIDGGASVIEANSVFDNEEYGVYTRQGTAVGNVVYGNEIGIQSWDDGSLVKDNRVFNNDTGIGVNGSASISGNQVYSNAIGMDLDTYYTGREIHATNNLIYDNSDTGILVVPARVESSNTISNNTIYQAVGDGIVVEAGATNEFSNNIIHVGSGSAFKVSNAGQVGFASDYNLFDVMGAGFVASWGTHQFSNRVDWFYELGFDGHSLEGDPQFVDVDGRDGLFGFDRTPIGSAIILDDEDSGVVLTGDGWTEYSDQGLGGDYWRIADSTGTARATWTFESLTPGTYELAVTFPVNGSHDVVYDATTEAGELLMSKRTSQSSSQVLDDFVEGGVGWRRLGFIEVSGETVVVTLSNNYDPSAMAADGMLLRLVAGDGGADDDFQLAAGSLGIDGGDPVSPYALGEPSPSGDRINIGAYGGTREAALSSGELVQVLSPNGNEKVQVGDPVTVGWRTGGLLDHQVIAQLNAGTAAFGNWQASPYLIEGDSRSWYAFEDVVDTSQVAEPAPQFVYQSYEQAEFGVGNRLAYDMPLADGAYSVVLHFAEGVSYSVGDRVFDILANSNLIVDDFDVLDQAGSRYTATTVSFDLTVSAGAGLLLELVNVTDPQALLSGIEIVRTNSIGTANPTVDLEVSTDGGNNWTTIGTDLPVDRYGNGSFAWAPDTASDNAIMRVVANSGSQPVDVSDASFQIAPGGNEFYVNVLGDSDLTNNQFASIGGSNLNHGKSPDQPMSSLFALIHAYDLTDGDIIYVDVGNYVAYGDIRMDSVDSGFRIQGPTVAGTEAIFDRTNLTHGNAFRLDGTANVTIDSLTITGANHGIFVDGSTGLKLSNNRVFDNSTTGIEFSGTHFGAMVDGNELSGNATGMSTAGYANGAFHGSISNNLVFGSGTGISMQASSNSLWTVSDNTVHSNGTGILALGGILNRVLNNIAFDNGTGITIEYVTAEGNLVYGNTTGITNRWVGTVLNNRVYGNETGIRSRRGTVAGNQVHSNSVGIYLDGTSTSYANQVESNLVYDNTNSGIVVESPGNSILNNTIYQGVGDAILVQNRETSVLNNIIHIDTGYGINVESSGELDFSSDFNLFSLPFGSSNVGRWGDVDQTAIADWKTVTVQDASSVVGDPQFVDINGADNIFGFTGGVDGGADDNFYVSKNSPVIDRGDFYNGSTLDFDRTPRVDDDGTTNTGATVYTEQTTTDTVFGGANVGVAQNWQSHNGSFSVSLPFTFSYFGVDYQDISISSNGIIRMGADFFYETGNNSIQSFVDSPFIAPLWEDLHTHGTDDDIFIETTVSGEITIRWKATVYDSSGGGNGSETNFAATLFDTGKIRFDYGAGNENLTPTVGISKGDGSFYLLGQHDGQSNLNNATSVEFFEVPGFSDIGAFEFRGSSLDNTAPTVVSTKPLDPIDGLIYQIDVIFSEEVNPIDANAPANYELRDDGGNGLFGDSDDVVYTLIPSYEIGSTTAILNIDGGLPLDRNYLLTIYADTTVHDLAGIKLDGDGDGNPGGNFEGDPANLDPIIDTGGPYTVNEGDSLSFDATGSSDPNNDNLTFAWDFDNDGDFGDAVGATPVLNWETLQSYGMVNDGAYTFAIRVSDGRGGIAIENGVVNVANVDPSVDTGVDGTATEQIQFVRTISFVDPGADEPWTVRVDWNGDGDFDDADDQVFQTSVAMETGSLERLVTIDHTYANADVGTTFNVTVEVEDNDGGKQSDSFSLLVEQLPAATVAGRFMFYNNSKWDSGALTNSDSIASNKTPLFQNETASFNNYTSYSKGINGILVDVAALRETPDLTNWQTFFEFKVGNNDTPENWATAPAPSEIGVGVGEGTNGSDRVQLIWSDGDIAKTWLQVKILANDNTGLSVDDVFYFGNAAGETGNSGGDARVNLADVSLTRQNQTGFGSADILNPYDFNRDGRANLIDVSIARSSQSGFSPLRLITPGGSGGRGVNGGRSDFKFVGVPQAGRSATLGLNPIFGAGIGSIVNSHSALLPFDGIELELAGALDSTSLGEAGSPMDRRGLWDFQSASDVESSAESQEMGGRISLDQLDEEFAEF